MLFNIDKSCVETKIDSHAHVERDRQQFWFYEIKNAFQLTRSRGAWPEPPPFPAPQPYFNSHAHMERDDLCGGEKSRGNYFNSHAHVERDKLVILIISTTAKFQLTRSRGAWPVTSISPLPFGVFQLTRSRGAWRANSRASLTSCIFQLTRSRGAWLLQVGVVIREQRFQLTRSRGAWRSTSLL